MSLELLSKLTDEERIQLAFLILRESVEKRKVELEKELDELKRQEETLNYHLSLVEKRLQEFMPEYERLNRYIRSLEYGQTVIRKRLQGVRDKINIVEGRFKNYISRLENILKA